MLKQLGLIVCLFAAALTLTGCNRESQTSDSDVNVVTEEKLPDMLAQPRTVLVDVRAAGDYARGHIPNAISIPLPDMRSGDSRLTEAKQIVVYAGGWTDPLSIAGAKRLMALGYGNVYEFKGGVEIWQDSGKKLITSLPESNARPETNR